MEDRTQWSDERLLNLIDLYRDTPCLWDRNNIGYKNKYKKKDSWAEIALLAKTTVEEAKRKMGSLLTSFRLERRRCERQLKSGASIDEIYVSEWFAFDRLRFLLDKYRPPQADSPRYLTDGEDQNVNRPKVEHIRKRYASRDKEQNVSTSESVDEPLAKHPKDQTSTFLDYVASKHRNYSFHTKSVVEHLISNILFEADMGKFEVNTSSTTNINTTPMVSSTDQKPYDAFSSVVKEECLDEELGY